MGLAEKINDKTAKIGIIGLGYVGLPLAVEYAYRDFTVIGIDIDKKKKEKIDRGENYIDDVESEKFAKALEGKKLIAETDFNSIPELDIIYICVPTPFTDNKDPDTSFIHISTNEISKRLRKDQLIILKSTTRIIGIYWPSISAQLVQRCQRKIFYRDWIINYLFGI